MSRDNIAVKKKRASRDIIISPYQSVFYSGNHVTAREGARDRNTRQATPSSSSENINKRDQNQGKLLLLLTEIHSGPGSVVPFPVGLARISSGWQRTSHRVVVVVAVVVASLLAGLRTPHRVVVVVTQ